MKYKAFLTALLATLAISAFATKQGNGNIRIKTEKASRHLVELWIEAYKAVNPNISISIVSGSEKPDLTLTSSQQAGNATFVGRYAILPVTTKSNPLIEEVNKKQWGNKDLRKLFFQTEDDLIEEGAQKSKREKITDKLTVFSGNNKNSSADAFAHHFGLTKNDLKGKRIAGDDKYLINAIEKENQSVTFNNLTYLYDLNSRSLKTNLSILPLNIKKEQAEVLQSGNLDTTLDILEKQSIDLIPVEPIEFTYSEIDTDIESFLSWVISAGQDYNHQAGFLKISSNDAQKQLNLLAQYK